MYENDGVVCRMQRLEYFIGRSRWSREAGSSLPMSIVRWGSLLSHSGIAHHEAIYPRTITKKGKRRLSRVAAAQKKKQKKNVVIILVE